MDSKKLGGTAPWQLGAETPAPPKTEGALDVILKRIDILRDKIGDARCTAGVTADRLCDWNVPTGDSAGEDVRNGEATVAKLHRAIDLCEDELRWLTGSVERLSKL